MTNYSCERCGKEFKQKCHYNEHINHKIPCKITAPESTDLAPKSTGLKNNGESNEDDIKCNYCGAIFTRGSSLTRHINERCKVKRENDTKMENSIKFTSMSKRSVQHNEIVVYTSFS